MNLKNGKIFTSKFVGTGPSSYEKIIYRAAVSQSLRNTDIMYDQYSDGTLRSSHLARDYGPLTNRLRNVRPVFWP